MAFDLATATSLDDKTPNTGGFDLDTATPAPAQAASATLLPTATTAAPTGPLANLKMSKPEPKIGYQDLYKNDELFGILKDYAKVSGIPEQKKDQTKENYVANVVSKLREGEFNTFFGTLPALVKMKAATPEDAKKMALGMELYGKMASPWQEGGQPGITPYLQTLKELFTDPFNYAGPGVGAAVGKAGAKILAKQVVAKAVTPGIVPAITNIMTKKATAPIVGAGVDAAIAVGQDVTSQKLKQEEAKALGKEVQPLSVGQMAFAALFSAATGAGGVMGALALDKKLSGGKTAAEQFNEELTKAKSKLPTTTGANPTTAPIWSSTVTGLQENIDKLANDFMKMEGAKKLDDLSPITPLTNGAIRNDMVKRSIDVAMNIIDNDPNFVAKESQQFSSVINEVFANIEAGKIDDIVLERAINSAGLNPSDFAQANQMTVSQSAQVLNSYSQGAKLLKRMTAIDPEIQKVVDSLYGDGKETIWSPVARLAAKVKSGEREVTSIVVSGFGTTIRNVLGTTTGLTYNAAGSLIEGMMFTTGQVLSSAASGKRTEVLIKGASDTMKDAFQVFGYLKNNGLASEVVDNILKANPTIRSAITSVSPANTEASLSKFATAINVLNQAQDAFFRKAIFTASVEKHMRRVGLDMYEVIGSGKLIPSDIVKKATDETLKATFSYMPKTKGVNTLENMTETATSHIIKFVDMIPLTSIAVPFPRFLANAMAFQYRYSPIGFAQGGSNIIQGAYRNMAGKEGGDKLINTGRENVAKGLVGSGVLLAAYQYRLGNQDTEFFNFKTEGATAVDVRNFTMFGVPLAIGDYLAKMTLGIPIKAEEIAKALLDVKVPAGSQGTIVDELVSMFYSEKDMDKAQISAGKILGQYAARLTQPFAAKTIYDFIDLFRDEGSIARDPNVLTSENKFTEAFMKQIMVKLPVLKEYLPPAAVRLKEGPVYREGEFFTNIVGFRQVALKSPAEKEVVRLGIDPYKLYGASSGDRELDRAVITAANPKVIKTIEDKLNSPTYKKLSDIEKRENLYNVVEKDVSAIRKQTKQQLQGTDPNKFYKMQFDKLSSDVRTIINKNYAKDHNGVTLEEADDYKALIGYQARLIPLKYASGGLVKQTEQAFAK